MEHPLNVYAHSIYFICTGSLSKLTYQKSIKNFRNSCMEVFSKKVALKKFGKFPRKYL